MTLTCEAHPNCKEKVVAQVGVPSPQAYWVCQRGFDEFQQKKAERKELMRQADAWKTLYIDSEARCAALARALEAGIAWLEACRYEGSDPIEWPEYPETQMREALAAVPTREAGQTLANTCPACNGPVLIAASCRSCGVALPVPPMTAVPTHSRFFGGEEKPPNGG